MIFPEELVNLFKKHGYWQVSLWMFILACVSLVLAIVLTNETALVNAVWCSANIYVIYVICKEKEEHLATKEKLADAEDNLCISKHEVERLTLELETYKSAQSKETGKTKKVSPTGEVGGVSKRRPAPKRKLKTEKKNENNMD